MANEPTPDPAPSEGTTEQPPAPPPAATSESITATPPAPPPPPATTSESITATPPAPLPPTAAATAPAPAPALVPAPVPTWLYKVDLAILALLLVLTFFLGSFTANNSDLWMHLAIGKRISEGEFTFGADPFSWLSENPDVFWVHQSWLYSWLLFQLHELVGGAGLVLIKAALFTIAVGLLTRIGWNAVSRWFVLILLITAALAASQRLLLQPIVISFLFLAITLFVLDRVGFFARVGPGGKKPCPRLLWVLPPLFALWANLDAWFILGPIVLGLCWAGAGLTRWFPDARVVPPKTLGLVFGVGLAACLLNPYHVRVFQLPPELAYLVVTVSDSIRLGLPNEIVGAGRTLSELRALSEPRRGEGDFSWTIPVVSWKYVSDVRFGFNFAGLAVFPLILLGLMAFTMTARIKPQPGAPTFHVGRFLLWLVFGVLALANHRMIGFFVLLAAPLTALTLGEFLDWQQNVSAVAAEKRDRGLKLARLISIPFVLLLLGLAWPGWLQGATDFASLRRVSWDVRADPSLKRTAEILLELKKKNQCRNVFNSGSSDVSRNVEVAHYAMWFAPGVKCGIDSRFALFADRVAEYGKVRKELAAQNAEEWENYFAEHNLDQVVVVNFIQRGRPFPAHWWLETEEWRQREGDSRAVIFSWAGRGKRWPPDDEAAWNRAAFGKVPAERRPPADGALIATPPSDFTKYLDGVPPTPIGVPEYLLLKERYAFYTFAGNEGNRASKIWMFSSLANVQALPEGGVNFWLAQFLLGFPWALPPRDIGPPALPILMTRSTRQAVADDPLDAQSRLCLLEAIEIRNRQEDQWAAVFAAIQGRTQYAPGRLREGVRATQLLVNCYALALLQPDDFKAQSRFAQVLIQTGKYDLALEHMQAAEKALEAMKPGNAFDQKSLEAGLKQQHERVQMLDKAVRQRLAKWKDTCNSLPAGDLSTQELALRKAELAFNGVFDEERGDKKVPANFGLVKKAFEILSEVNPDSVPERSRVDDTKLRFQVLLAMGRANDVLTALKKENMRKSLPPEIYAVNLLLAGAALGDYDAVDQAFEILEKTGSGQLKEAAKRVGIRAATFVPALLAMPKLGAAPAMAGVLQFPLLQIESGRELLNREYGEFSNTITLRGIFALEAGNTDFARKLFQRAIDEAGETSNLYFTERPVARRYLDLLNEQKR